jgi:hypothetical protein
MNYINLNNSKSNIDKYIGELLYNICKLQNTIYTLKIDVRSLEKKIKTNGNLFNYLLIEEVKFEIDEKQKELNETISIERYYKELQFSIGRKFWYDYENRKKFQNIINPKIPCKYCKSEDHLSSDGFYCKTSRKYCICDCRKIKLEKDEILEWDHNDLHPTKYSYEYEDYYYDYHNVFTENSRIHFEPYTRLILSADTFPKCVLDYLTVIEEMQQYFLTWEGLVKTSNPIIERFEKYKDIEMKVGIVKRFM